MLMSAHGIDFDSIYFEIIKSLPLFSKSELGCNINNFHDYKLATRVRNKGLTKKETKMNYIFKKKCRCAAVKIVKQLLQ